MYFVRYMNKKQALAGSKLQNARNKSYKMPKRLPSPAPILKAITRGDTYEFGLRIDYFFWG